MGFAAVSAGVYTLERDDSLYTPAIAPTVLGLVGTATKGPLNEPTLITNTGQLLDVFGVPRSKDLGMHAAVEALKECRLLHYCRIAGASASVGQVDVNDVGSGATPACTPYAAQGEPYHLDPDDTIILNLPGPTTVTATFEATAAQVATGEDAPYNLAGLDGGDPVELTLRVDGGPVQTASLAAADFNDFAAATAAEVAAVLNAQLFGVSAVVSGATVQLRSDTRGTASRIQVTGGGANVELAFPTGEVSGTGNVADITEVTGAEVKAVVEDESALVIVDLDVNGAPRFCTEATGEAQTISVSADSTAIGAAPKIDVPTGEVYEGSATDAPKPTVRFKARSVGSHSAQIQVRIEESVLDSALLRVSILERGRVSEIYEPVYKGDDPEVSGVDAFDLIAAINDGAGDGAMTASQLVEAEDLDEDAAPPAAGTYALVAGDDGDDWTPGTVIGSVVGETRTGLQVFADPEQIFVTVLATPGIAYPAVISAALDLCEQRGDTFYVADVPRNLTPDEVRAWHNGAAASAHVVDQEGRAEPAPNGTAFNSSYGAFYYDWYIGFDGFNDAEHVMPQSATILRTLAFTDATESPWSAPAGPTRSRTSHIRRLITSPGLGARDLLQMPGNNINPVAMISGVGVRVWGQKTMQKAPTALDRVNVRRLLLYAKKVISVATLFLTFEPNDPTMWRRFVSLVNPVLDDIKERRGLDEFRVQADSSTNTPLMIERNTFVGVIYLVPTRTAEKIIIPFNILGPGQANFDEAPQS